MNKNTFFVSTKLDKQSPPPQQLLKVNRSFVKDQQSITFRGSRNVKKIPINSSSRQLKASANDYTSVPLQSLLSYNHLIEHVQKDGRVYSLACGPLVKPRYVNPMLEKELVEFKKEIEEKHSMASTKAYVFPRRTVIFTSNANQSLERHVKEESRSPDRVDTTSNFLLKEFLKQDPGVPARRAQRRYLQQMNPERSDKQSESIQKTSMPEIKFKISHLISQQSSKLNTSVQTPKETRNTRVIKGSHYSRFKENSQQQSPPIIQPSRDYLAPIRASRNEPIVQMGTARQVIVNQPSQNNTIILMDSSYRDSGGNIWQSLEQSGVLGPLKNRKFIDEYQSMNIVSGGDQQSRNVRVKTSLRGAKFQTNVNTQRKRESSLRQSGTTLRRIGPI